MFDDSNLLSTYARFAVDFSHAEGMYLYGRDKRCYLDFNAGVAVNSLGHAHPHLLSALRAQIDKLWHVSNLYHIDSQARLGQRLAATCFADKAFFCNSGAEAIEAAIKLARRYHYICGREQRWRVLTLDGAFHGRTFATLAAAKNAQHLHGFGPAMAGFEQVAFGDIAALRAAVKDDVAAILLEPVQGEGGMRVVSQAYLQGVREIADEFGLLLILDEVQSGNGRTGQMWAHQWSGIDGDIMATAKGLGGGFPIGALLASAEVGRGFSVGSHGSTFGGNPLAMAAGHAVLDIILADGFLASVRQNGAYLWQKCEALVQKYPHIYKAHSGAGLMQALQCSASARDIVAAGLDRGLLLVAAAENKVRLLPPLIVGRGEIDAACEILSHVAEDSRILEAVHA